MKDYIKKFRKNEFEFQQKMIEMNKSFELKLNKIKIEKEYFMKKQKFSHNIEMKIEEEKNQMLMNECKY